MVIKSYDDLEVYKRSYELALAIHDYRSHFRKQNVRTTAKLGEQRKHTLNIAEGYGRKNPKLSSNISYVTH